MNQKGDFHPLGLVQCNKEWQVVINLESQIREFHFELLDKCEGVVSITAEESSNRLLYSLIGNRSIVTSHFGRDYDGEINPKVISKDYRLIENIYLQHVSKLERLNEKHTESTKLLGKGNSPLQARRLVQTAFNDYSNFYRALINYQNRLSRIL